ncbi:MAG: D-aminoacylase, partial [Gammaproteobacteria bacterium]|nr:D-aminoacylase [Gammaproteobacteria bacterium]
MMLRLLLSVVLVLAGCGQPADQVTSEAVVDLLISGGTMYDGSGSIPVVADIAVSNNRIVFIGDAAGDGITAAEVIDAAGQWVTPGFIDAHSHAELDEDYGRDAIPFLRQGVTTVVLGMDGG